MKTGIILLDKASGISSAKAIAQVKHALQLEKIGHAGTLDPSATGLLVCLAGKATRAAAYAVDGPKIYTGTIRLGLRTSTDDITGEILEESLRIPDDNAVLNAVMENFTGALRQVPPQISAVKIQGEPAYKRVRKRGETVEIAAREVFIETFDARCLEGGRIAFEIRCSPGTYIRSIARDLGEILGCGGCVESLSRKASYPFELKKARKVEELEESDILPWFELFPGVPYIACSAGDLGKLANGDQRPVAGLRGFPKSGEKVLYGSEEPHDAKGLFINDRGTWKSAFYIG